MANPGDDTSKVNRLREGAAIFAMSLAVLAVYWSPVPPGMYLFASDYNTLHDLRMRFARQALFEEHRLPAWYSSELLGTPFWSNVQNFPFIPTRLLLLAWDPLGPYTYTLAINLAAILAALFTYLFCRRIGVGMIASVTAGWTFACCGFFASRIAAGHLPFLEPYCALPLMLWLVESIAQSRRQNRPSVRWIFGLALSSACLLLAGHPQLPVYALSTAAIYALWRDGWRNGGLAICTMAIGAGCAAFALVPMTLLINRSTRILPLAAAFNNLPMPYGRLAGFFLPWLDGAPPGLTPAGANRFHGYISMAYFWDTFVYTGWLPWIAAALLAHLPAFPALRPRWNKVNLFVLAMGIAGLLLSTPLAQHITSFLPGTFLRSPARLLYFTEFALSLALAAAIEILLRGSPARWTRWLVPILLAAHWLDVRSVDREFLPLYPRPLDGPSQAAAVFLQNVAPYRVALDTTMPPEINRIVDDIGFFDSIMLAGPYRWMVDLTGAPPDVNVQKINGSDLQPRALEAGGVKYVITFKDRPDLRLLARYEPIRIYAVEHPASRAAFYTVRQTQWLDAGQIHQRLRDPRFDAQGALLLPTGFEIPAASTSGDASPAEVEYRRPNSDQIECTVRTSQGGYLRIIESWDPGWLATGPDGTTTTIAPAMDALIAVPITAGKHEVRLEYHTPGALAGRIVSFLSLAILVLFAWWNRNAPNSGEQRTEQA